MKKKLVFILISLLVSSINLYSQGFQSQKGLTVSISQEKLKPNLNGKGMSSDETLNQIFKDFEVIKYYQSYPSVKNIELQKFYKILCNGNVDSLENLLRNRNFFDKIYQCGHYRPGACSNPVSINDTWIVNNWINNDALNLLDAQCAWTVTTGNSNIVVGVIDTEFEITHEDLVNTFVGVVGTPTYPLNHGTAVSSCVAAGTNNNKGIAGIGYNTRVKGYCTDDWTLWDQIWQAYLDGIKIINVSWWGDPGTLDNVLAVEEMTNNGVVLVFCAGNGSPHDSHSAFADIPGVINVGGVDANNNYGPTGFSRSAWVDVCALSTNVAVCYPGNTYDARSGTSYAAPQVAGVVALIRSINKNLSPAYIENIIKTTTDPIADAHLYPGQLGTGRTNAYKAVSHAVACVNDFVNQIVVTDTIVIGCDDLDVQNVQVTNDVKLDPRSA